MRSVMDPAGVLGGTAAAFSKRCLMSDDESSEYSQWVQLANDPSQSEEARQRYRALMEAYIHEKLREAFQLAAKQTPPAPTTPPPAKS
jgi:hypothetical protein